MSFSAAVQWWEDWQLRLLVLASLFFQYFLFAAAVVRKLRVPHWFRALIWLAYQGGDVVAIYALATLFNRHKEAALATNTATAHLETLWAPILLLHLGGQDGITAYSIEDNENWRRHLLVSVSQITVAIYVFRKSWWSGDMILLRAAIVLFIPGVLKCLEKPWALKNATVTSMMNSCDSRMEETLEEDEPWALKNATVKKATPEEDDGQQKGIVSTLEEYVKTAAEAVANLGPKPKDPQPVEEDELADTPYHLFVDLGHPYSIRLRNLKLVAPPRPARRADVHGLVRTCLSRAFDRLYTKHRASYGGLLRAAVALVTLAVIGLFQRRHRGVYDRADVVVTYVLLSCTAALELVSACLVLGSGLPRPDDKVAQYNLVDYLARGEKHRRLSALARRLGASLQLDRLWCTAAPEPSLGITRLVYDHVARGWKEDIGKSLYKDDATTGKRKPILADGVRAYRRFNDSRGQRTLEREKCDGGRWKAIEESLRMPFDESVLLWHLATEFCYCSSVDAGKDAVRHSRTVSNYMAYLLFVEPEMLIPGARSKLFRATYHKLRKMLKPPPEEEDEETIELEPTENEMVRKMIRPTENEMARKVIRKVKRSISLGLVPEDAVVHKAWAVAHELMEFAKDKEPGIVKELKEREVEREKVKNVLLDAKEMADKFMRDKFLNDVREVMGSAKEKAKEAMEGKTNFITAMKEAKAKTAQLFIKGKQLTKEDVRITEHLRYALFWAEESIKYEEEKKEAKEVKEQKKVLMVTEFCNKAGHVIELAEKEDARKDKAEENKAGDVIELAEKEKKKLKDAMEEAKKAAEVFINGEKKFTEGEKEKNRTEVEKKITGLLESAWKKADEFIKNEQKMAAVEEFSKQAGEAIGLVEKEKDKLEDLMERNLIDKEEELSMIRGRERADDKMWAVIQGVWVEMLCFSAGRCRGYLHAKRLGNGGEYLSYVWLLLYYMGMETMPERMQRPPELPLVGDTGVYIKTPPTDDERDEEPTRVRIRRRTAQQKSLVETPVPVHTVDIPLSRAYI